MHSEAAAQYGIHAVPTMFIVIDGTATERIIGYKSLAEIENITKKY
ncbi:MAG: thioredoxin family protein [Mycoplasmoidaceae bacterium]|nr:thioredoxin family protein [Mycoplasmoidaceae bacterium]